MKQKVTNLVKLIIFIALFLFIFVHVSYMCRGELSHSRKNLSGYYALEDNSLDLVIFGTSGTFSSYAPMEAYEAEGYTSYNFSTNVMGADTMPFALKEIVKTQRPKAIVIDIYPFIMRHIIKAGILDDVAVRYNTDGYKYSLNRIKMISDIVPEKDKLTYYLDIFKYHDNTFTWSNFFGEMDNLDKGYNSLDYGQEREPVLTSEIIPLHPELETCLSNLIDECRSVQDKYGIKIEFIFYPYANLDDQYPESIGNVNYIAQRLSEEGFSFINCQDFRSDFNIDADMDYWDAGHFNIYGAEKVTRVLAPVFAQKYDLPDHRGEAKFSKWDEEIAYWDHYKGEYKAHVDEKKVEYYAKLNDEAIGEPIDEQ